MSEAAGSGGRTFLSLLSVEYVFKLSLTHTEATFQQGVRGFGGAEGQGRTKDRPRVWVERVLLFIANK